MDQASFEQRNRSGEGFPSNGVPSNPKPSDPIESRVTWKDFIYIAKPGILFSNMITAIGGFWIAARGNIDWMLLVWMLLGTLFVMASGCVLNNYLDRDLDQKMERTRHRPTANGKIRPQTVLAYGISLGIAGLAILFWQVNVLSGLLGLLGLFVYVFVYTLWLKRRSVWNTVVGAIAGAMPPVIGYTAVTMEMDIGAWILFGMLFLWQPPHFWALGIMRKDDYSKAGYKMLPVVKGVHASQMSILRYVVLLVPVSVLLYMFQYVGILYLIVAVLAGLGWVYLCVKGFTAKDINAWSRKVFVFSINYLTVVFLIMLVSAP